MEVTRDTAAWVALRLKVDRTLAEIVLPYTFADCGDTGYENGAGIQAEELYNRIALKLGDVPELPEIKEYIDEIFTLLDKAFYINYLQYIDYENDIDNDSDYYCDICEWVKANLLKRPETLADIVRIFFTDTLYGTLQGGYRELEKIGKEV